MIRAIFSKLSLPVLLAFAPLVVNGCSEETRPAGESTADSGTLSMPLVTSANGHTYRLTGYLYLSGPTYRYLSTGDETELSAALPTGDYWASLYSYGLQRLDDTGNYQYVDATLVSSSQAFTIYNQASTTISFQFETDGLIVTVGSGNLAIQVDVTETPPLCTPLGDDCATGTWCAPPELTGRRLACVAAGSVASGEPCASPLECEANTTCYDFGGGPVCTGLCHANAFDAACPDGDTCSPVGSTYGVCAPGGQTLPGGGGGEGGAESGGNGSAGGEG